MNLYAQPLKTPHARECACGSGKPASYMSGTYVRGSWRRYDAFCAECAGGLMHNFRKRSDLGPAQFLSRSGYTMPDWWTASTTARIRTEKRTYVVCAWDKEDDGLAVTYWPRGGMGLRAYGITHLRSGCGVFFTENLADARKAIRRLRETDVDWKLPGRLLVRSQQIRTLIQSLSEITKTSEVSA